MLIIKNTMLFRPGYHFIESSEDVWKIAFINTEFTFNLDTVSMRFRAKYIFNYHNVIALHFPNQHIQLVKIATKN